MCPDMFFFCKVSLPMPYSTHQNTNAYEQLGIRRQDATVEPYDMLGKYTTENL